MFALIALVLLGVLFESNLGYFYLEFGLFIFAILLASLVTIVVGAMANYEFKSQRQEFCYNTMCNESKSIWIYRQVLLLEKGINELKKIMAVSGAVGDSDEEESPDLEPSPPSRGRD